jgi:hypothetical protein
VSRVDHDSGRSIRADIVLRTALLFERGGERRMCDSRWEYWSFLRDEERTEDEARRPVDVIDERDAPEPEAEPEPESERELVHA